MKVFLDDVRHAPEGWMLVKTVPEALDLLRTGEVEELSLDHDLGLVDGDGHEETGYSVLLWIEEQVALHGFVPPVLHVHSANPPGRQRMLRAIEAIEKRAEP